MWLEGLGDWAWPGRAVPEPPLPPAWVPAVPPRLEYAAAGAPGGQLSAHPRSTRGTRRILVAGALSTLLAIGAAVDVRDPRAIDSVLGIGRPAPPPAAAYPARPRTSEPPLPALQPLSEDRAGSEIETASYRSPALDGTGSFLVYLPPGYSAGSARYPVLYLLHGRNGHANAFLEVGIQRTLDRLIREGAIPPMIAVMVQDRPGLNNWRNIGRRHSESYVVEVQELIDRMLRTIPARSARAIAGSSMGGFGAMHVALSNPYRFAVVESWLGYFNNLEGELHRDASAISRLGMRAFLYGAVADPVAMPWEDPEFAAELRAEGAQAESAIYPGGHSLEKVQAHLETGLLFAGRSLTDAQRAEAIEEAHARWRTSL